jgi:hypothetical protein
MAVSVGFYSVVVRTSTIKVRFPGGMRAFEKASPNASFCADDYLARVGFMAFDDASAYLEWLHSLGFVVSDGSSSEIALVREDKGHLMPCDWLDLGLVNGHPVAWLAGAEPGSAVIPACDHTGTRGPLSAEELEEEYEFLGHDQGVETHRSRSTGELVYIARGAERAQPVPWWNRLWRRLTGSA